MDMAGAVGWAVAGPSWKAALALVAQEAQTTGTTLERALREGKRSLRKEGPPPGHPGPALRHLRGVGRHSALSVTSGSPDNLSK